MQCLNSFVQDCGLQSTLVLCSGVFAFAFAFAFAFMCACVSLCMRACACTYACACAYARACACVRARALCAVWCSNHILNIQSLLFACTKSSS